MKDANCPQCAIWKEIVKEDCDNEDEIREIAKTVLSDWNPKAGGVYGDRYGVPSIVTIVEAMAEKIKRLEK